MGIIKPFAKRANEPPGRLHVGPARRELSVLGRRPQQKASQCPRCRPVRWRYLLRTHSPGRAKPALAIMVSLPAVLYMVLYALIPERWQFYLDFRKLRGRQRANSSAPTVDRRQYWLLLAGKVMFVMWALVVPALHHPLWCVALLYLFGAGLAGLILATVLQWAHCVEGAMFLSVQRRQERLPETWLRIQVDATRNVQLPRWLSWYVGGLDHQIEHHRFALSAHNPPPSGLHDRRVLPGQPHQLWPSPKSSGSNSRPLPLAASNGATASPARG